MIDNLLGILSDTGIPFVAYKWDHNPPGAFGVVSLEGGADTVFADGHNACDAVRGSIDLYAPDPSSSWPNAVRSAIDGKMSWRLNSVQYEDDTRLIHYEWVFETEWS